MFKLNLRKKVLLTTILLFTVFLVTTNLLWINTTKPLLNHHLQESQQQIGFRASEKVKDYIDAKIQALIIHSQSGAFLTQNRELQRLELFILLSQDRDIERVALVNTSGKEEISIKNNVEVPEDQLMDKSKDPGFLTTTFRYGKEYISEVFYSNNKPAVTVSIPVTIPQSRQQLTNLTTAGLNNREAGEILGVLQAEISLANLFDELTSLGTQQSGDLYIIDANGKVIAHPDTNFSTSASDFSELTPVQAYKSKLIRNTSVSQTSNIMEFKNEYGQDVFGTFVSIPRTSWAVVIQQPVSVALGDLYKVNNFAALLLISVLALAAPAVYLSTKRFTDPVGKLVDATVIFGKGDLDYRVNVNTQDELKTLADAFNKMASSLSQSRKILQDDREVIAGERDKLALILSGISDAVIAVDTDKKIILFNSIAESVTGYSESEVIGKSIQEIFNIYSEGELIAPDVYCPTKPTHETGTIWSKKKLQLKSSNGTEKNVNLSAGQIKDGPSIGIGCIITLHDLSKEKQLEEMKLDFVSMAAHELRTPLTAIRGYAELLMQSHVTPENSLTIKRLVSSSENLSNLIDNLLNASRIERGKLVIEEIPMDLKLVSQSVIDMLTDQLKMKNQKLETVGFDKDYPTLLADPTRIQEVITNLLINAINYTNSGGTITISLSSLEKSLRFSISDTGHGIPEEAIPHLFSKFYRVHGSLEMGSKGTGLGLFISKSIIDLHQGNIWVESTLGKGSTFTFELPIPSKEDMDIYQRRTTNGNDLHSLSKGVILNPTIKKPL